MKSVAWTGASDVTVEVANAKRFIDGKPTVMHLARMKCVQQVLNATDTPVPALARGASITLTVKNMAKGDAQYLVATANSTSSAPELATQKANNVKHSAEYTQACLAN